MICAFAVNITLAYKSVYYYKSRLALGWTAQKFKYYFDQAWKNFDSPTVIWFDHSSFDASQNQQLRRAIAEELFTPYLHKTFPQYEQPSAFK